MTITTRSTLTENPSPTTTPTIEHYSIRANKHRERDPRATRSKDSHLGITIRGCGPASGRPRTAIALVDLDKIVSRRAEC